MRVFGVEDKPRFSIKWPNGTIESFGTCNDKETDRSYIICISGGEWFLVRVGKNVIGEIEELEGAKVCNGYYEHERDEWVDPWDFAAQDI